MKLEDITVRIRPREPWEAIDLGFKFTQQNWRAIYTPWLLFLAPVIFIATVGLQRWPLFSLLLIWWLKPVYDRILLSIYSRILFNDTPGTEETLRDIPTNMRSQLLSGLSYHRFSFARSFFLPVTLLEKLTGKERKNRCSILSLRTSGHAIWLTVTCLLFELIMSITLVSFIYIMLPETHQTDFMSMLFGDDYNFQQSIVINILFGIGIYIIEPFYVAAGFMLYINRRTILEGWDIELSFRNINQRISRLMKGSVSKLVILFLITPLFFNQPAEAEEDQYPEEPVAEVIRPILDSDAVIQEIFEREEMGKKEMQKYLEFIGDIDEPEEDPEWFNIDAFGDLIVYLAQIFKVVLILIVIVLIAALILNRDKWLHLLGIGNKPVEDDEVVETLFGMDLRPDSLPNDIASSARALAEKNDLRGALSLLYRGALSILVNQDTLAITSAHTEHEILGLADSSIKTSRRDYLGQLTNEWIMTAYSQTMSVQDNVLSLCEQWPNFTVEA